MLGDINLREAQIHTLFTIKNLKKRSVGCHFPTGGSLHPSGGYKISLKQRHNILNHRLLVL